MINKDNFSSFKDRYAGRLNAEADSANFAI